MEKDRGAAAAAEGKKRRIRTSEGRNDDWSFHLQKQISRKLKREEWKRGERRKSLRWRKSESRSRRK
eukprot:477504-Hanusia_phi.AAC.1